MFIEPLRQIIVSVCLDGLVIAVPGDENEAVKPKFFSYQRV